MPSNTNFVCFSCRTAIRRPKTSEVAPSCPDCHEACVDVSYKVSVPPKHDVHAWERLRATYFQRRNEELERFERARVRAEHALEAEIARLEARPSNPGRSATLRERRAALAKRKHSPR